MRNRIFYLTALLLMLFILPPGDAAPSSPIWALHFTPDGRSLAVAKYQGVELWDIRTGQLVSIYEPHAGAVRCLAFSHDGATLFAGGGVAAQRGEIRLWDVSSQALLKTVEIHADTVESIALSPNSTSSSPKLLTASMDEYSALIQLSPTGDTEFNVIDENTEWLSQHVGRVLCTLYHPRGDYFVTGSEDKTIKVWHPENYTVLVNLDGNDDAVYSLAYAADSDMIVSGSADNVIRSWRVTSGEESDFRGTLVREYTGHRGPIYSVDCGIWNNQEVIVSGSADTSVILWNLRSGNRRRIFDEPTDAVYAVQLSPDGTLVAAGGRDGVVRVWHIRKRQLIHELKDD